MDILITALFLIQILAIVIALIFVFLLIGEYTNIVSKKSIFIFVVNNRDVEEFEKIQARTRYIDALTSANETMFVIIACAFIGGIIHMMLHFLGS